jgi:hypothetical protein
VTATISPRIFAGPLDIELQGRLAAAIAQARALLGAGAPGVGGVGGVGHESDP